MLQMNPGKVAQTAKTLHLVISEEILPY